jgi:hypothetical protein
MTEPKLESIKEISDYLDMKYKTKLLWINFTEKNEIWNGMRIILPFHHPL